MRNVVIIGSGPAGYTAAIYTARAGLEPLLISGLQRGGQLTMTTDIENFPGFEDGLSGYDLMDSMEKQAIRFGTEVKNSIVESVDFSDSDSLKVILDNSEVIDTKSVIISTGASARYLGLSSEKKLMNKGVSACATCDGAFFRNVPVVVVGGGDTAIEEAIFLTRFASKVYLVHRRDELRASAIMKKRAEANSKIQFVWNSTVLEILDVDKDVVTGIKLKNIKTKEESQLECEAVFMAIGHTPNTQPFKNYIDMDEQGYIILKNQDSKTNIKSVFVAGDCADKQYRQAITAAGMGCKAAIDAEQYLAELSS